MKSRFSKLTCSLLAILMIVSCMSVFAVAEETTEETPSITVIDDEVLQGTQTIQVTYSGIGTDNQQWIGFYPASASTKLSTSGSNPGKELTYKYLNTADDDGIVTLTISSYTAGKYYVVLFSNNSYNSHVAYAPVYINLPEGTKRVVSADGTHTALEDEAVYTTISSAIDSFGGREGTIYIKGEVNISSNLNYAGAPTNFEGSTPNRALITLTGYGNTASGGKIINVYSAPQAAGLNGDLKYENITLTGTSNEVPFHSCGYKLIFGSGIEFDLYGSYPDNYNGAEHIGTTVNVGGYVGRGDNNVDIYSGLYKQVVALQQHSADGVYVGDINYNIYGGHIAQLSGGPRDLARKMTHDGDTKINIYDVNIAALPHGGGTFPAYFYVWNEYTGKTTGDTIFNIYGGTYSKPLEFHVSSGQVANNFSYAGNSVVSVWGKGANSKKLSADEPLTIKAQQYVATKISEDKKYMVIFNNSEEANAVLDSSLTGDKLDYVIKVEHGNAVPVFERTIADDPSTSTFKGFRITSDISGLTPVIDGEFILPGEDGLYNLSSIEGDGAKTITFAEKFTPVVTTDATFVPAQGEKVFTTIKAAIDALSGREATIYIKGEINVSNKNGAPANFEGTVGNRGAITFSGYGNNANAGKIIFIRTAPGAAAIKGDIIYDNITITGATSEYAHYSNGHKITFGAGVVVDRTGTYESTGEDEAYSSANANIGAHVGGSKGSHYVDVYAGGFKMIASAQQNGSGTINGEAHTRIFGGSFDTLYSGTRVVGGSAATGITFTGDNKFDIYGGTFSTVRIGHETNGNVEGDTILNIYAGKFNKNIEFFRRYDTTLKDYVYEYNKVIYPITATLGNTALIFWGNGHSGNTINGTAKVIVSNDVPTRSKADKVYMTISNNAEKGKVTFDASLNGKLDYIFRVYNGNAVPVFEEATAGDRSTSTFKGFKLTSDVEGKVPTINGTKLVANEGLYDLSAYAKQPYDIKFVDEYTLENGTLTVNVNDFDITTIEEDMDVDGKLFLGWFDGNDVAAETVVDAGAVLTAKYVDFDTTYAEGTDESADLVVLGAQIRLDNVPALRFITELSADVKNAISAVDATFDVKSTRGYGHLVVPTEFLGEGETILTSSRTKTSVAENLFEETEDYTRFTVCITSISVDNYDRAFAVLPYVTYKDAQGITRTGYGEIYNTASVEAVAEAALADGSYAEGTEQHTYLTAIVNGELPTASN